MGYKKFKAQHLKVVTSFLKGRDVFAILPNGFGKSLCYACLPFAFESLLGRKDSIVVVITLLNERSGINHKNIINIINNLYHYNNYYLQFI